MAIWEMEFSLNTGFETWSDYFNVDLENLCEVTPSVPIDQSVKKSFRKSLDEAEVVEFEEINN